MKKILLAYKSGCERIWEVYTWDFIKMEKYKRRLKKCGYTVFIYEVKEDAEFNNTEI